MAYEETWENRLYSIASSDALYGTSVELLVEEIKNMVKAAANPYPSGWFKADGPLPEGSWYWWKKRQLDSDPAPLFMDAFERQWWSEGWWCGPILTPPAQVPTP